MPSGRPSIGTSFHSRVESFLKSHPELGYKNTGELLRALLREFLREHEDGGGHAEGSGPRPFDE